MGKLVPTALIKTLRNAKGAQVFYRHKVGISYRTRVAPANTATPARTRARNHHKASALAWNNSCTEPQRQGWRDAAKNLGGLPRTNSRGPLSGYQLFCGRNNVLQNTGQPITLDFPGSVFPDPPSDLVISTLDASGPSIDLEVFGADGPTTALIVYASPSLETDQLYFQKYRRQIATFAPGWTNPLELTTAWETEFGTLPGGGRVGFEVAAADTVTGEITRRLAASQLTAGESMSLIGWITPASLTPPSLASLTWGNQRGSTATPNAKGALVLDSPPANGDNISTLYQSPPAPPWTMQTTFVPLPTFGSWGLSGLALRDSISGKLICWLFGAYSNGLQHYYLEKYNSYTSAHAAYNTGNATFPTPLSLAIQDDNAGNYVFLASADGQNWITRRTVAKTDWLPNPADQIGICVDPIASAYHQGAVFLDFKINQP